MHGGAHDTGGGRDRAHTEGLPGRLGKSASHHNIIYNLVRFYVPMMDAFQDTDTVVLFDDDVHVLKSLPATFTYPAGVAMLADCDVPTASGPSARVRLVDEPYFPRWRTVGVLRQLADEDVGEDAILTQASWNFGVAVVDLRAWRARDMTNRYLRAAARNDKFGLFEWGSLSAGLVLAQIAFAGMVGCAHFPVASGGGYLREWIPRDDALALHYNGARKPWVARKLQADEYVYYHGDGYAPPTAAVHANVTFASCRALKEAALEHCCPGITIPTLVDAFTRYALSCEDAQFRMQHNACCNDGLYDVAVPTVIRQS